MLRALLHLLCRAWFAICVTNALYTVWMMSMFARYVLPGSVEQRQDRVAFLSSLGFQYLILLPCPWIRIQAPSRKVLTELLDRNNVLVALNHTSFFDTILFVALCPPPVLRRYRTLMKASLFQLPFLGGISRAVGHFPVPFISPREEEFQVDKVIMGKVMEGVRSHVSSGGCLSIFPEGSINRNPRQLLPFRYSSLAMASEFHMTVVTFTMFGSADCWPKKCAIGGFPCEVRVSVRQVSTNESSLDSEQLRLRTQECMQRDLDSMYGLAKRSAVS